MKMGWVFSERRIVPALIFLMCIFTWMVAPAVAADVVILSDSTQRLPIGINSSILIDETRQRDVVDISANSHQMTKSDRQEPSFGYLDAAIWVRVDIHNAARSTSQWALEVAYPPMQEISVFVQRANDQFPENIAVGGGSTLIEKRPYFHRNHIFPIDIERGETVTVYARFSGENSLKIPLYIAGLEFIDIHASQEGYYAAVYLGILFALILYSFFLYRVMRESAYVSYALFLVGSALVFLSLSGYGALYLWADQPWMSLRMIAFSAGLMGTSATLFSRQLLEIAAHRPRLDYALAKLVPSGVVVMLLAWILPYKFTIIITLVLSIVAPLLWLTGGFVMIKKGHKVARYYVIAWSVLIIGLISQALSATGLMPANTFSQYGLFFGSAIEAIILSVALALRIKTLNEEKAAAQLHILQEDQRIMELVDAQNQLIEKTVAERKKQLDSTQKSVVAQQKLAAAAALGRGLATQMLPAIDTIRTRTSAVRDTGQKLRAYLFELADGDDELLIEFDRSGQEIQTQLKLVNDGANRIESVVIGLTKVHQLTKIPKQKAAILDVLDKSLRYLLSDELSIHVTRSFVVSPTMDCWPDALAEAFNEVLINSVFAIKQKSFCDDAPSISITSRLVDFAPGAQQLEIVITDNGVGMADDILEQAFDPFFTTRPIGSGTGLGLSTSRDIIAMHNGTLRLDSKPGEGTQAIFMLPIT